MVRTHNAFRPQAARRSTHLAKVQDLARRVHARDVADAPPDECDGGAAGFREQRDAPRRLLDCRRPRRGGREPGRGPPEGVGAPVEVLVRH